jgi:hypothetical protein
MPRSNQSNEARSLARARSAVLFVALALAATSTRSAAAQTSSEPEALLASERQSTAPAQPLVMGPIKSSRSIAAMMFDIGGGAPDKTEISDLLVGSARSLRAMYREISYGMQDIDVELLGPYTLPEHTCLPIECCGPKSQQPNGPAVQTIIDGYAKEYDHYFWVYGDIPPGADCGTWGDEGSASNPAVYSSYSFHGLVGYSQELGHNFGMTHEPYMTCPSNAIFPDTPGGCTHHEYGSAISFMGRGAGHPSAFHKVQQGWLSKCNGVKVGATATITLLPLEVPCDGVQVLQIKSPKSRPPPSSGDRQGQGSALTYYYVELRTPRGMDAGLKNLVPSVMVYAGPDFVNGSARGAPYVYLLDQTPEGGNNPNLVNAGLTAGQTFTDPAGGVSIKVNSVSQDKAEVLVTLDGASGGLTCLDGASFTAPGPDVASCGAPVGPGGAGGGGAGGVGGTSGGNANGGASGGVAVGGAAPAAGGGGTGGAAGVNAAGGGAGASMAGSAGVATGGGTGGTAPGASGNVGVVTAPQGDSGCACSVPIREQHRGSNLTWTALGLALARIARRRKARR